MLGVLMCFVIVVAVVVVIVVVVVELWVYVDVYDLYGMICMYSMVRCVNAQLCDRFRSEEVWIR